MTIKSLFTISQVDRWLVLHKQSKFLLHIRNIAQKNKDWSFADAIRWYLEQLDFRIRDYPDRTVLFNNGGELDCEHHPPANLNKIICQ